MQVANDITVGIHVPKTVKWLANKPSSIVIAYSGYFIIGFKFTTKDHNNNRVIENSGVNISTTTLQVSSSKDENPHTSVMEYCEVLVEIWEIEYLMAKRVVFKCDWVDSRWVKINDLGFTIVDL